MLGHGFSGSESSRDSGSASLRDWKHSIDNTLACDQRHRRGKTVVYRSGYPDRPFLGHCKLFFCTVLELKRNQGFINGVASVRYGVNNSSLHIGRHHTFVDNSVCLRHLGNNISAVEILTFGNRNMGIPFFLSVQGIHADTAGNKCPGRVCDPFQRTFDTVENIIQNTGGQRYRNGAAAGCNFFSGTKPGCLLIHLNCGQIFVEGDYFAYQFLLPDIDHLRHGKSGVPFQVNDGPVNSVDCCCLKQCRHLLKTKIYHIHCAAAF